MRNAASPSRVKTRAWRLRCPECGCELAPPAPSARETRCPGCGARFEARQGIGVLLPKSLPPDIRLSIERWNEQYKKMSREAYDAYLQEFNRDYLEDTRRQLLAEIDPQRQKRYLEIGCGPALLGLDLGKRGFEVYGVDFCVEALALAQRRYREHRLPIRLVGGDLHHLPLADESVDFIYGGGVIEHFKDTLGALKQLQRVLAPGGVAYNTVPYFSVGALTYRQKWGNIPNLPVLRPLFEWLHLRLLGGKHMTYGYEMSFTAGQLIRLHRQAGFRNVEVRRFDVFLPLYFIPGPLRPLARALTRWRPFWPMVAVIAKK